LGALSIVRYRTPIKDPLDLIFVFWTIGVGISSGAGLYLLALTFSAIVSIGLLVLSRSGLRDSATTNAGHLLIARFSPDMEIPDSLTITNKILPLVRKVDLRHRSENNDYIEVVMEVTLSQQHEQSILDTMRQLGAHTTTLLSGQGKMISY
jgi:uncharacterized membrane protein YhiD involved in acid resistance